MAVSDNTRNFSRVVFGSTKIKNLCKVSFGHTETQNSVAATSNTSVLAATAMTKGAAQTIVDGITDPDVPRALIAKPAGTAASVGNGVVVITGTNVEGATITDNFQLVDGSTTAINGTKAFKTVTSVLIPAAEAAGATISVGCTNRLGTYHRLFPNNTTVKVLYRTTSYGTPTIDSAPTINDADDIYIEKNLVTPATAPDGANIYDIYYIYDNWSVGDIGDQPDWMTTTSTSSTSTSTTTSYTTTSTSSTSISSTSISTSSTSSSTSSTSSSVSTSTSSSISTSTSTTTVP